MLPILIVPDAWWNDPELSHRKGRARRQRSPREKQPRWEPELVKPRTVRQRCRPQCVAALRIHVPALKEADVGGTTNLTDCERLLKLMLRYKWKGLSKPERSQLDEMARCLGSATPFTESLSINAAAWLLWSMSWRGISSVPQVFAPQVHPPTLMLKWWTAMPAALRFGCTGTLQRLLWNNLEETHRIWRRVASRMRSRCAHRLDPNLVQVRFRCLSRKSHR